MKLAFILCFLVLSDVSPSSAYNGTDPSMLREDYDFIIVGGGSAGCRLAEKLSNSPYSVLVIEAGGVPEDFLKIPLLASLAQAQPKLDWTFKSEPQKHCMLSSPGQQRTISAGKVLGGGSSVNFMAYQRGSKEDFDSWSEKYQLSGWSYDEVLKYFKEDETNTDDRVDDSSHGRTGPLVVSAAGWNDPLENAFIDAAKTELNLEYSDPNDGDNWGVFHMHSTINKGKRHSSYDAFIKPNVHKRANLHILLHSFVTRVIFDENKRAIAVEYIRDGKKSQIRSKREIILSAGAMKTPHILMLSGIGNEEQLSFYNIPLVHAADGVGENLQDHYGCAGFIATGPKEFIPHMDDVNSLYQYYTQNDGTFTSPCGLHTGVAYTSVDGKSRKSDVELLFFAATGMRVPFDLSMDVAIEHLGPLMDKHIAAGFPIVQRPKSRGTVRLSSADPLDPPSIDPNYFSHPDDLHAIVEGSKQVLKIIESPQMKALNISLYTKPFTACSSYALYSDEYIECFARHYTFNVFHQCCTARMGYMGDPMAVVNDRLSVYGVENLRIADTSVMPDIVAGHLNSAAIMIGAKAGDMILEDQLKIRSKSEL